MTSPLHPRSPSKAPSLEELTTRYLTDPDTGTGSDASSEVELYEVSSGFRPSVRSLWVEVFVPLRLLGLTPDKLTVPTDWSASLYELAPRFRLPMAGGIVPQQIRNSSNLIEKRLTSEFSASQSPVVGGFATLRNWIRKATRSHSLTTLLVASGIAAVLGEVAEAESALAAADSLASPSTGLARGNQRAAVYWILGRHEEARGLWTRMPENPVVSFNRGLVTLAQGKPDEAITFLRGAATTLPDTSGWSHLAWILSATADGSQQKG